MCPFKGKYIFVVLHSFLQVIDSSSNFTERQTDLPRIRLVLHKGSLRRKTVNCEKATSEDNRQNPSQLYDTETYMPYIQNPGLTWQPTSWSGVFLN